MQVLSTASNAPSSTDIDTHIDMVTELLLTASRALVAVAARSLAAVDESVTLPQFRVLVILASRGPRLMVQLAEALGIHQSTATRVCDRLVAKGLVERSRDHPSRREVQIDLTAEGRRIVHDVSAARRADIEQIVARIPPALRSATVEALTAFNDAAGEIPQPLWTLGWQ
jgi:DNA-binding MarR family transcriptional regulator